MSTETTLAGAPTSRTPQYPDVLVQLTGLPDSSPVWIEKVGDALEREVGAEAALAFTQAAIEAKSRNDLLIFILQTVDVV